MAWTFYNASGEVLVQDGAMTIANNTNNRVVTATGADPASLNGEANLTFDGTDLTVGAGNVIIGTAGKGIDFSNQASPASGMTSELLDRYEEGTFTPGLGDSSLDGSGESQSYTQAVGRYTRIGNRVFFNIKLLMGGLGSLTTSQDARIMGLPFVCINVSNSRNSVSVGLGLNLAITAQDVMTGFIRENVSYIDLQLWELTTGTNQMLISELSADADLAISGQYETAS